MTKLLDLILDYERRLVKQEIALLKEWNEPILPAYEQRRLEEIGLMIKNAACESIHTVDYPTTGQIDDLFLNIMTSDTETYSKTGSPQIQLSKRGKSAAKKIIRERLLHYYNLFKTAGEFDTFEQVLRTKFPTKEEYLIAVQPILEAEASLAKVIMARASGGTGSYVIIVQARDSARQRLAESIYGRS